VAAVSLAPYEQTRHTALVASALLALSAFVAVALAARWLISKALSPVARMTRQAGEWSEHNLERRFALGPPRDELTELAFTLDRLLDRLAASLRHEQRLSAELSHELRTPLASIAAEAQFALRHADLSEEGSQALRSIHECALRMGRTLETLIATAQAQLDPQRATSDARAGARAAIEAAQAVDDHDVAASLSVAPQDLRVAVEQDLVERILAPLLENARRHATDRVKVSVARGSQGVMFTVSDDGEGIDGSELEAIFEPGRRARGAVAVSSGAGLGLALARRLARSAGGDVRAEHSDAGGRFTVQLPAG
jgi:signal transduction histidine kinase